MKDLRGPRLSEILEADMKEPAEVMLLEAVIGARHKLVDVLPHILEESGLSDKEFEELGNKIARIPSNRLRGVSYGKP